MKLSAILSILFVSASAMASQMPNPILEYTFSNGPVNPIFQKGVSCKIYADGRLVVVKRMAGNPPRPQPVKHVAWTNAVPSAEAAKALVKSAEHGNLIELQTPIGGAVRSYFGIKSTVSGAPVRITLWSPVEKNDSKAAATLVDFLTYNCENQ